MTSTGWSERVINAMESVLRYYEFARHVGKTISREVKARGFREAKHIVARKPDEDEIKLPRWDMWCLILDDKFSLTRKVEQDLDTERDLPGVKLDLAFVFISHFQRRVTASDTSQNEDPKVRWARGTLLLQEWTDNKKYKAYLIEYGQALNEAIAESEGESLPTLSLSHIKDENLDWNEAGLKPLSAIKSPDKLDQLAGDVAGALEDPDSPS